MAIDPGSRLGPYEIVTLIGAGGMGEVYRAWDSRLGRTVAVKVLSGSIASKAGRRERFEREARAIASLNHPHICDVYDVGRDGDVEFLVMEHLEGRTLADRLLAGPLDLTAVIRHAIEIAEALDHAHRQGIVHRDLKPGNVMLTKTGAKLLDFGLAKVFPAQSLPALSTMGSVAPLTADDAVLGTFQYMAPEQLEGKEVDGRTDLFAFGAVVYEMVTARRAFEGTSQASLIGAILHTDPPSMALKQPVTPPALDRIVKRCLAKDPDERWQTARDLIFALRGIETEASTDRGSPRVASGRSSRERLAWVTAILATALAVVVATLYLGRASPQADLASIPVLSGGAVRSEIAAPENTTIGAIALSPDGRRLAFIGLSEGRRRLWVRALDAFAAQPLAGTDGADSPFWSPDGRSLGFFAEGKLKRIEVSGGPSQALADVAVSALGGTWNQDGIIIFSPNGLSLHRIPARGGISDPVTQLDVSRGEISHRWPRFLPGGQHFLYLAQSTNPENRGIFVGSLDGKTKGPVVRSEFSAAHVAPGYLLFLRDNTLMVQPFRAANLELEGNAVPLAGPISVDGFERAHFEISPSGILIYRRGGFLGGNELAWFNREGERTGSIGHSGDFRGARLSPDGQHVAAVSEDPLAATPDIWIYDLMGGATHFTLDAATDNDPVWSWDGRQIAFRSVRGRRFGFYLNALRGTGKEDALLESDAAVNIHDWSRDGRFILFSQVDPAGKTGRDIWILPMQERKPYALVTDVSNQDRPRFSPNGRWVAYESNERGGYKIYVTPFPASGRKFEASLPTVGGTQPIWSRSGELFYLSPDNTLMAVDVREQASTIVLGPAKQLFSAPVSRVPGWSYDVDDDGRRFLLLVSKPNAVPLTLVVNWPADLKK
jgi:Tol biopolymer transport system component